MTPLDVLPTIGFSPDLLEIPLAWHTTLYISVVTHWHLEYKDPPTSARDTVCLLAAAGGQVGTDSFLSGSPPSDESHPNRRSGHVAPLGHVTPLTVALRDGRSDACICHGTMHSRNDSLLSKRTGGNWA